MLEWEDVYELVLGEVSRARAVDTVRQIHEYNGKISFTHLSAGARRLTSELEARGLEAEHGFYPADGKTMIGGRMMPLAWDVTDGELHILDADDEATPIVSVGRVPRSVVMYAAATDGFVEAPVVYFELEERHAYLDWKDEDFEGLPIRGSCVFTECRPDAVLLEKLVQFGAVGFILDGNGVSTTHHEHQPDAIRWVNDAFGEGMITRRTRTLPGFSIPPRKGAELRRRLQAGEELRARFRIESRTFDGEFNFVRGIVPGRDRPEERVFLLAHLFEPNATNDCGGVAISTEALTVLRGLIDGGKLPPPARTIEGFFSWELWGVAAYAFKNPELREHGVAGLDIESLVRKDDAIANELLLFNPSLDVAPSFINALLGVLLPHACGACGPAFEERHGFSGNDNVLMDPTLGPPTAYLGGSHHFNDGTYHTDADTADKLDPDRLAHITALAATFAYVIASASADEACRFADMAAVRARERITQMADAAIEGTRDCPDERLSLLAEVEHRAIASVSVLSDASEVKARIEGLVESLDAFTDEEINRVRNALGDSTAPAKDEALWKEAASVIPVRKIPGPVCLQDASDDVRSEFESEMGTSIYSVEWYGSVRELMWADGRRTLADIARLLQLHGPVLYNDKVLARLRKLFRFLERHGYLEMKKG